MKKNLFWQKLFLHLIFFASVSSARAQLSVHLDLLGQVVIPYHYSFRDTPIGGLSGLAYDPQSQIFYVISDDRGSLAPPRFYSFRVKLNKQGKLAKDGIQWEDMVTLKAPDGNEYANGTIDPEGIALGSDTLIYISSEGNPGENVSPFIHAYSKTGKFVTAFPVPDAFWTSEMENREQVGVRVNLAFEGLSISPDGTTLYAALENALIQDGPAADSIHGSPSRIIVYKVPSGRILHQYQYNVAPVHYFPASHGTFAVNGLSDMLALDNQGNLLTMERNYVEEQGNQIFLYAVSTHEATDIKDITNLSEYDHLVQPVSKKLISNLSDYGITVDNFEGLVLGPGLPDGSRLLLLVSDDNFSETQKTIFTGFSLYKSKDR